MDGENLKWLNKFWYTQIPLTLHTHTHAQILYMNNTKGNTSARIVNGISLLYPPGPKQMTQSYKSLASSSGLLQANS